MELVGQGKGPWLSRDGEVGSKSPRAGGTSSTPGDGKTTDGPCPRTGPPEGLLTPMPALGLVRAELLGFDSTQGKAA